MWPIEGVDKLNLFKVKYKQRNKIYGVQNGHHCGQDLQPELTPGGKQERQIHNNHNHLKEIQRCVFNLNVSRPAQTRYITFICIYWFDHFNSFVSWMVIEYVEYVCRLRFKRHAHS